MFQKTHAISLKKGTEVIELNFRLPVASQLVLSKKYRKDDIELVMDAMTDIDIMLDFFTHSLSFKGNENAFCDGVTLYDLLVDNGYCGKGDFSALIVEIAASSGMLKPEQAKKLSDLIVKTYDKAFDLIENEDAAQEYAESSFRTGENAEKSEA